MKNEICAVIVTFNRKNLLLRNIKSILKQTRETDILIFDNCSTDGTRELLEENGVLTSPNIIYYHSEKNTGGAGGFCEGLKIAYAKGYNLFWLMDDDGYCYDSSTLDKLLDHVRDEKESFILNSTVICDNKMTLTFGFLDIGLYQELINRSKNNEFEGFINPFNGTLISRECINTIGFPKGEFFIYGDEHEFMLRALKKGIRVATIVDSLYYHPVNRKINEKKVGKYTIQIKQEPVWKTYCEVRNGIYITKNYYSKKMLLIKMYLYLCAAVMHEKNRYKYIKYSVIGLFDAMMNNFDRPIMFDE